ncbi:NERD domain-containing protein [Ornithinibacillus gellani]|uniref:nuclease-related domain-containing protein n=1 Tax=Ornithinibacillus gellani TaxID=2293253 RepID=UPI000F49932B|nr:nuclease-related domain-containing protein [Ornithinibacillus gellani]TQS76198.1 NERD domain-containing protein [Ornithinibacillus gellani]
MFTKPMKSDVQKQLETLSKRTSLTIEQQQMLDRLVNGHLGELQLFDKLSNGLSCNPISLYNLLLKVNHSEYQMDGLLIFQHEIILLEVKNFQGDYLIENNNWYTLSKEEIKNPLHQLHRAKLLLQQLLQKNQTPMNIRPYLVFVHPNFHLYQAPVNIPVIFPGQLERFIKKLQHLPCEIHKRHHELATFLESQHLPASAFEINLTYDYHQLKKGIFCDRCDGPMILGIPSKYQCTRCNHTKSFDAAILKSVFEFHTLFPDKKITTRAIAEWTNNQASLYKIRKVLSANFSTEGSGRIPHYQVKRRHH